MALSTLILKTGNVPVILPGSPIYAPSSSAPKKAAIVKAMRFTNTGGGPAKLRAWFKKGGGPFALGFGARRILYDECIPAGCIGIEDEEVTLNSGDGLYFQSDVGLVQFVLFGVEQDIP